MNAFALLADFDPIENRGWVGLGLFTLLFGVSFLFAVIDKGRRISQSALQLVLSQMIFIPLGVYLTFWCYGHPERLAADPDAYLYDMRIYWKCFALFQVVLLVWFVHSRWWSWEARAVRLMKR